MQFDLLRLSLLQRAQQSLFSPVGEDGKPLTREQWLRQILSKPIVFAHRGAEFHFVPEPNRDGAERPFIVARIGRKTSVQENEPPEAGLHETKREAWRASLVLIDPRHHPDGQKVGFEVKPVVGKPLALFGSLVAHLNMSGEAPYFVEVNAISEASTFWEFVEENRGNITQVTFEFVAPNMFGVHDDYDKEMAEMREVERVAKAKLQLENRDGLELNTERVKGAVAYTVRGAGSIKAKAKRNRKFNSERKVKSVPVPLEKKQNYSFVDLIKMAASAIFKT